jgi:NAD(P)-dependent dehydrogenase (short-subunit alcohol dehydrogenase family)
MSPPLCRAESQDFSLKPGQEAATAAFHPVGRVGSPEDMAGLSIFLATKASAFVTGSVVNLDGGVVGIHRTGGPFVAPARL